MVTSIEEYKELRAEIRYYLARFDTLRRFGFLVTLGVIGFGFSRDNAYMLFLASGLMILFLWQERVRTLRGVFRLATYLETVVEPHLNELHWESFSSKHDFDLTPTSKLSRMFADLDLPALVVAPVLLLALVPHSTGGEVRLKNA